MVIWLALLIGIVALGYAWRLQQDLARVTRRLDRYNRALYDANDQIRRLEEELADTAVQLRVELGRQQPAALTFTPKMTVRAALAVHPQVEQILAGFHLGGCSSCAVVPDATLTQACREQGRDLEQLLQTLNALIAASADSVGPQLKPVKIPNVEFSL
jgi:hypothetical protein